MQTRLLRLAAEEWHMSIEKALNIFKMYNILHFIEVGFGIFHCEGDYAVLEDIEDLLERKGYNFDAERNK